MSDKSITLTPSHKSLFWWYLLGIVLIPLFGVGIYLIYRFYKTHASIEYTITDRSITARDSKVEEKVDLINIEKVDVEQKWIDEKFDVGDLEIKTESRTIRVTGMEAPSRLAGMIYTAAEAERKRISELQKKNETRHFSPPARNDRIDYLTGLWQQGLISEEDFLREKKHFEE